MEDGNITTANDDDIGSLAKLYAERPAKITANGHDISGESSLSYESKDEYKPTESMLFEDKSKKRINPLRIHLGKRPFVDNSFSYNTCKKKKPYNKFSETAPVAKNAESTRVPKLIPKRFNQFHNIASHQNNILDNEHTTPVPRLVPKSQLPQYKKGKIEKGAQLKEYAQSLGLQPMVKFKCRKCCSMSFQTLAMLKEHQLVCRAQSKEPAISPEAAPNSDNNSGPSRVTRKLYLCSACGTYYENWNLFLHMREIHNRHICLFCLGMFSKAEKLSSHLANKHNVQEFNYDSKEDFLNVYDGTLYLMCCSCDAICSEKDDFFNHDCDNVKPKPVPVLVSKTTNKPAALKTQTKISNEISLGSAKMEMYSNKPKEETNEKLDTMIPHLNKMNIENNNHHPSSEDSVSVKLGKEIVKPLNLDESFNSSCIYNDSRTTNSSDHSVRLLNGEDTKHYSPEQILVNRNNEYETKPMDNLYQPMEKEGGIKLKLSLNKANSPVIINSTVDPTVGQQSQHKPPTRVRRPPKRYEKDRNQKTPFLPKTPSIKMTICDKANSSFVKSTIYDDNEETILKNLLNNNLQTMQCTPEYKPDTTIKTTIYDNKIEDNINTLNRVPKLTVKVPKELLDKDSSSDYSSDSDVSDKLTVDENTNVLENKSDFLDAAEHQNSEEKTLIHESKQELQPVNIVGPISEKVIDDKIEDKTEINEDINVESKVEEPLLSEEIPVIELTLDKPLDKYPLKELLKLFLSTTIYNCIYCNHVRKIAVNCEQLSLHMVSQHRFSATVNSITAEELMPETFVSRVKNGAEELRSVYINLNSYDSTEKSENVHYDHIFECFQCYFKTPVHKDLYLHNRKMHQKTMLLCVMCKTNFYSYSELLCHMCPGTYESEFELKFRCCLCSADSIPSSFRLMVHLRKIHHTCDVCLEFCYNQAKLSNHVWKHKLHHLCYRCGIAYRNKPDITKHLFWKHGTESELCKNCLQKKWPHVYHFCTPPSVFVCEECALQFTRAVYLKVHKRVHTNEFPHPCTDENCTEKFISKKLLSKHLDDHKTKLLSEDINGQRTVVESTKEENTLTPKEPIQVIDLIDEKPAAEAGSSLIKAEPASEQLSKKAKKRKLKDKDALLLDVNLPALNLSESDSSDESDSGIAPLLKTDTALEDKIKIEKAPSPSTIKDEVTTENLEDEKSEHLVDAKPSDQQVLDIWDNFKKYQAKVEKQKEKTPPLVPIRKHVCESDHDYCLIPTDLNGDDDMFSVDKKKNKKSPKKKHGDLSSSSSSSSSDSDSSCSCGSNCSCSSSSGSSSSSSSDSESSDESGNEKKKHKQSKKLLANRRLSNGSNVDVMGVSETPILLPEKIEPPIAETDLETDESDTDEEFYDEHPQKLANKLHAEKRNQLLLLASVVPSGQTSLEASRCTTPVKEIKENQTKDEHKEKSSKKKSKKKKKSRGSKKHGPIKLNIPKDVISQSDTKQPLPLIPNKITISLQTNTVQIPDPPPQSIVTSTPTAAATAAAFAAAEKKRASKRRRVPNKFYGYSSDEETPTTVTPFKPQPPPKLEWRKEDLPSPVTHKIKKDVPSSTLANKFYNYSYTEPIRLTAPVVDPEPPRILMNSESMESSDSDTSEEGALEICQPNSQSVPAPNYLNSGTSSLPYAFQRPTARQAKEGESVYCYCRCPYDEVSEMIACDAEGCAIEWFHFECVGIMVPPKGKWYCPECRKNQNFSGYR